MSALQPGDCVGILGGGQLGRMLAMACASLGLRAHIFAPEKNNPAFDVASATTIADYDDKKALRAFAKTVDVITYEFENVPAQTAALLADLKPVRPSAHALKMTQDRLTEKDFIRALSIPLADFAPCGDARMLQAAVKQLGFPCVLKTRRMGYDGKGQMTLRKQSDVVQASKKFAGIECVLEQFIALEQEISVIAARDVRGNIVAYDVTENVHRDHILHTSTVPAKIAPMLAKQAMSAARKLIEALDYVGVLSVEFFVDAKGRLLVNEMAPRVHNSGHWTLDAAAVSQFENHIRAIAGWPLGSPQRLCAAMMTNLVGEDVLKWQAYLAKPHARLWLYGKAQTRQGRKMGHVTQLLGPVPKRQS